MSQETVITKVQALLAKSRSAGASEAEAASALAAAHKLLAKHNLTMVEATRPDIQGRASGLKYMDPWIRNMAAHCTRYYGCEPVLREEQYVAKGRNGNPDRVQTRTTMDIYGRPSATVVVVEMITYLYNTVIRMSNDYSSERARQLAYRRGAGERLADRLYEMRMEQIARSDEEEAKTDGTALIIIEQNEAKNYIRDNDGFHAAKGLGSSNLNGADASNGWYDAEKVQIGGQVGSTPKGQQSVLNKP